MRLGFGLSINRLSQGLFSPLSLFANGEQGAWYDPSDLTTLYQDSAGTTPVAADGDPVGLMLDKSQGLVLGADLVTNGDFSDPTGWTIAGGASISGGKATVANAAQISQSVPITVGSWYELIFDIDASQGVGRVSVGGTTFDLLSTTKVGSKQYFLATTTNQLSLNCIGGASVVYDNISVKELSGNHALQSISANRRLYKTNGQQIWLLDDLVDDGINAQLPNLGTNSILAYADGSGVTILTGQTISGSTPLPTVAETYGVIYLDRPLTASETESVTAYLNGLRGA